MDSPVPVFVVGTHRDQCTLAQKQKVLHTFKERFKPLYPNLEHVCAVNAKIGIGIPHFSSMSCNVDLTIVLPCALKLRLR